MGHFLNYFEFILEPLGLIGYFYVRDLWGFANGSIIVLAVFSVYRFFLAPIVGTVGSDTVKKYKTWRKNKKP